MNNVIGQNKKHSRRFGRKQHSILQRDIKEDMFEYELSFEYWNVMDEIQDDMDISYDDEMMIDYDILANESPTMLTNTLYNHNIQSQYNTLCYPWIDTTYEAEFLFMKTNYSFWIAKSVYYNIPDDMTKTIATLEWLEAQGGIYSLLFNDSKVLPQNILQEMKRSSFWSYTFLMLTTGLQIKV